MVWRLDWQKDGMLFSALLFDSGRGPSRIGTDSANFQFERSLLLNGEAKGFT